MTAAFLLPAPSLLYVAFVCCVLTDTITPGLLPTVGHYGVEVAQVCGVFLQPYDTHLTPPYWE